MRILSRIFALMSIQEQVFWLDLEKRKNDSYHAISNAKIILLRNLQLLLSFRNIPRPSS
jgi:hypothetical protein